MNKSNDIKELLKALSLDDKDGHYENHFYVINLEDSNDYAKMYTLLDEKAVNTEEPNFGVNSNKTTVRVTNYFEFVQNNTTYNIFLIADFDKDLYYVKIGEQ